MTRFPLSSLASSALILALAPTAWSQSLEAAANAAAEAAAANTQTNANTTPLPNLTNINQLPALEATESQLREQFLGTPPNAGEVPVKALETPDTELNNVSITACWLRAMPLPELPVAAYFSVSNQSQLTINLTGVSSPNFRQGGLQQIVMGDGNARTISISSVPIGPGDTQAFSAEQMFALFSQARQAISAGDTLPVTFLFGTDGRVLHHCRVQPSASTQYQGNAGN